MTETLDSTTGTTTGTVLDPDTLTALLGRILTDLGATGAAGSIALGHRLGLWAALAQGPATPADLAARTGCHERYLAEWLRGQAAGGYVTHDAGTFLLTPEQAFVLADPAGPDAAAGFRGVLGYLRSEERLAAAFRTGEGIAWHEHHEDVFTGCAAFYAAGYAVDLVPTWIPALDGVSVKLAAGGRVADVGCGLGATSIMIGAAFPNATVVGSDNHDVSITAARERAAAAGVADRVRFELADAAAFTGEGYDLVTTFDCLHDLGDPVAAARRIRESLAPDGTWMLVEPAAGHSVADNLNPVGRAYYSGSTFLCVPNALAQDGGWSLGAQAGEFPVRQIAAEAGFTRFREASRSAFNAVYEIRP